MMTHSTTGKRRLFRSLLLIAILLGAGTGLASLLYALREEPPRRADPTLAPVVRTVTVFSKDVTERFAGYGTAQPDRSVRLAAELPSTVAELVDEIEAGSVVAAGQLLIRLDEREYRHNLDRAEALAAADQAAIDELVTEAQRLEKLIATAETELRVARGEKERLSRLFEQGQAAKKEFDFANLAYQQARRVVQGYEMELAKNAPRQARLAASKRSREAEAALAGLNVERCRISAPFSGTIAELRVDVGDRVAPGSVLLTLIDPQRVEIPIQLPAAVFNRVEIGAPCRVQCESMPEVAWQGQVARMAASADEATRTFSVYVDVDNTNQRPPLIPGVFVRAEVEGAMLHDRILIPRGAIREGRVLVVEDKRVAARSVAVERLIGDQALINGEVRSGDRVLLSHLDRLTPGAQVRIPPAETASSTANLSSSHRTPTDSAP